MPSYPQGLGYVTPNSCRNLVSGLLRRNLNEVTIISTRQLPFKAPQMQPETETLRSLMEVHWGLPRYRSHVIYKLSSFRPLILLYTAVLFLENALTIIMIYYVLTELLNSKADPCGHLATREAESTARQWPLSASTPSPGLMGPLL